MIKLIRFNYPVFIIYYFVQKNFKKKRIIISIKEFYKILKLNICLRLIY